MPEALKSQVINVQVLRALAALSVVVGHAWHDSNSIASRSHRAEYFFPVDWTFGVDVFFVTSGFIMLHTTAQSFGDRQAWRTFLFKRLTRIVPLYWLLTTMLLVGGLAAPTLLNVPLGDITHIVASYVFIPDARAGGEIRPVMALGWSLNYEMLFYALFAAMLRFRLSTAVMALTGVLGGLALFGCVFQPEQVQLAFWSNSIVLEFVLGVYLGLAHRRGLKLGVLPALLFFVLGWAGAWQFGSEVVGATFAPHVIRNGIPATLIVAAAVLGPSLKLRSRLAVWGMALGSASYSLYLIHPFVIRPLREVWLRTIPASVPLSLYVVVCVCLATALALATFRWIERPLNAFSQRLVKRGRGKPLLQPLANASITWATQLDASLPQRSEAIGGS